MQKHIAAPAMALERVSGIGRIAVTHDDGATRLVSLYQDGAAKIRLPARKSRAPLEAVLINTAGGVTGGDRLDWRASAGANTRLTLTTPAAEKTYRAGSGEARVSISLDAGPGASIAWLPQETILFDGASLSRRLEADLAPDARLLIAEAVIFGREAMGERLTRLRFHDRWRVRRGGVLLHAEEFRLGPDPSALHRPALLAGAGAMASLLFVAPEAEDILEPLRAALGPQGGASAWNGRILARLVAADGFALRQKLLPALALLNGEAGLPKLWSI